MYITSITSFSSDFLHTHTQIFIKVLSVLNIYKGNQRKSKKKKNTNQSLSF